MMVRDVMTRRAETIGPEETIQAAARKMKAAGIGLLVVCEEQRPVGVLTDRDIVVRSAAEGRAPASAEVRSAMTAQVVSCRDDEDLAAAAALMGDRAVRRLVVIDAAERLAGLLSVDDVALHSAKLAGEIVGRARAPEQSLEQPWDWRG